MEEVHGRISAIYVCQIFEDLKRYFLALVCPCSMGSILTDYGARHNNIVCPILKWTYIVITTYGEKLTHVIVR